MPHTPTAREAQVQPPADVSRHFRAPIPRKAEGSQVLKLPPPPTSLQDGATTRRRPHSGRAPLRLPLPQVLAPGRLHSVSPSPAHSGGLLSASLLFSPACRLAPPGQARGGGDCTSPALAGEPARRRAAAVRRGCLRSLGSEPKARPILVWEMEGRPGRRGSSARPRSAQPPAFS